MILTTLAFAGLLGLAGDSDLNTSLFESLDANADGLVEASEVDDQQQVWFTRALRVADTNSDGRLTPDELNSALSDPDPRHVESRGGRGQGRRIDPQRLDRNGDGMITLEEVPGPGKERFERLLQRTGKDSISVDELRRLAGRADRPGNPGRRPGDDEMKMEKNQKAGPAADGKGKRRQRPGSQGAGGDARRRPMEGFDRLDANGDGKVTQREARRVPRFLERFDSNEDGIVERSEVQAAMQDGRPGRRTGKGKGNQPGKKAGQPAERRGGKAMFDRFDTNSDGSLSRDEAPPRMKQRFDRIDADGNGRLTPQELAEAMQKPGRPKN